MILIVILAIGGIVIMIFFIKQKQKGEKYMCIVYPINSILCMYLVYQIPAIPEDLPLKRNEAYATVSGVSMQRNEAYSVVVPLQRNVAYENVERPANTLDTQTNPEYEIVQ